MGTKKKKGKGGGDRSTGEHSPVAVVPRDSGDKGWDSCERSILRSQQLGSLH